VRRKLKRVRHRSRARTLGTIERSADFATRPLFLNQVSALLARIDELIR